MDTKPTITIVLNDDGSRTEKVETRVGRIFSAGAVRTEGGLVLTDFSFEIAGSFRNRGSFFLVLSNGAIVNVSGYL